MKRLLLAGHARRVVKFAVLVFAFAFAQMASAVTTFYVTTNGTGDGSSWASPTNNLQGAIDTIEPGAANTVWVSNGVYEVGGVAGYPAGGLLTNRIAIWQAITVRSANNDPTNTIIKGRFQSGEPGVPGTIINGPAAVRCVYMVNNSSLIGFTLTNGATFASGNGDDYYGGGVYSPSTSPIISNCVIAGNSAGWVGGGAYLGTLYNCTLSGNSVTNWAGGAYGSTLYGCTLIRNSANPVGESYPGGAVRDAILYNCTLISNSSTWYSGAAHSSIMSNCTLIGNSADYGGGGSYCTYYNCRLIGNSAIIGGAARVPNMYNCTLISNSATALAGGTSYGTLSNCTLTANYAPYGGGAYGGTLYNCLLSGNRATDTDGGGAHNCTLYNCTLNNNYAFQYAGGAYQSTLNNCILYFNTADSAGSNWYASDTAISFTNCCTAPDPGVQGVRNITGDPMFVANGSGYGDTYVAGNYHLSANSPCINTGTNQDWMTNSVDLDSRIRIRYGTVDMGAYEAIYRGTIFTVR